MKEKKLWTFSANKFNRQTIKAQKVYKAAPHKQRTLRNPYLDPLPLPLLLCPRTRISCNNMFLSRLPLAKSVLFQAIVPTRFSCPAISRTNLHCAASQIKILPEERKTVKE